MNEIPKMQAIVNIMKEARTDRASRTAMRRFQSSLRALGLASHEITALMRREGYFDDDGEPFPCYRAKP